MKKVFLFFFIFFSLFFIFASNLEAACTWNKRTMSCGGTCTYGSCSMVDIGVCQCRCTPSCYCAQFICKGTTCSNGCGGSCAGTKTCATPTPAPYCLSYLYNPSVCPCGCTPTSSGGTCSSCCLSSKCPCGCTSATQSGGSCKSCSSTPTPVPTPPVGCACNSDNNCVEGPGDPNCNEQWADCGGLYDGVHRCPQNQRVSKSYCGVQDCGGRCTYDVRCDTGSCTADGCYTQQGSFFCGDAGCNNCQRQVGINKCPTNPDNPAAGYSICSYICKTDSFCGVDCGGDGGGTPGPGTPTPSPTPAPDNPTCTIAGPSTLTLGESGDYRTISTAYNGGDANAEIDVNTSQSITGSTRLQYSDCGGVADTCEVNATFTPVATGTYYVFCRGYNDGIKECRPFDPYDSPSSHDVDCDPDSTPDTPPAGDDFITVVVTEPGPWWQVKDSDVTAMGGLTSVISTICTLPGCNPFFDLDGSGGFPGVPIYSGTTNFTTSDISSKGWLVNTSAVSNKTYDYASFARLIPAEVTFNEITSSSIDGTILSSTGTIYNGVYWFHYDGEATGLDLEITSNVNLGSRKVVLMVEGANLNIRGKINLTDSSGFFFTMVGKNSTGGKGDLNIDPTVGGTADGVPELEGLYLSDGSFHTGAGTTQLHIRGSVVSLSQSYLERDLPDDSQTPAEYFEYAPDQVMLLPTKLQMKKYKWKEVAP